jgi:hypothetical protein
MNQDETASEGPSLVRRFHGSVNLAKLHLWRVGKTTDLDTCFQTARDLRMLSAENEAFIRRCLATDARYEAGEDVSADVTPEDVHELQMNVLRLNSADPA